MDLISRIDGSQGRKVSDIPLLSIKNLFWVNVKDGTGFSKTGDRTFTVTDNATNQALFKKGTPLRYSTNTDGSSARYGIVHSYSSGTVTVSGAPMPATVNFVNAGPDYKATMIHVNLPGVLQDSQTNYLRDIVKAPFIWRGSDVYIVGLDTYVGTAAVGGGGITTNIGIGASGNKLSTTDFSIGTASSAFFTDIEETNYLMEYGDEVFVHVPTVGSTTSGSDLVIALLGVYS